MSDPCPEIPSQLESQEKTWVILKQTQHCASVRVSSTSSHLHICNCSTIHLCEEAAERPLKDSAHTFKT